MSSKNILLLTVCSALILSLSVSFASVGTSQLGSSSITLSLSSATLQAGQSVNVTYTVSLVNGSSGDTFIGIGATNGITTKLSMQASPSSWSSFSGAAELSVSRNISPGVYNISFSASGADPTIAPVVLRLTVTANASSGNPPSGAYPILIAVIVIVGLVVAILFVRQRRNKVNSSS